MSGDVDGRGGLNLKHIQSIKIVVPPMEEQLKFVSIAQQADKSGSVLQYRIAC
jgi:type I restriction enzyme S subunit